MIFWIDELFRSFCVKQGCWNHVTKDSLKYFYPHSRWYSPAKRLINPIIDVLLDFNKPKPSKGENQCQKIK